MYKTEYFPPVLKFYLAVSIVLSLASLIFTSYYAFITKTPYPYGPPIFAGLTNFTDLTDFGGRFKLFGTPSFWHYFIPELDANYQKEYPLIYPAPLLTVVALLFRTGSPLLVYLTVFSVTVAGIAAYLCIGLSAKGCPIWKSALFALVFVLTSWPVALTFARANLEGADLIFLSVGVVMLMRDWFYAGAVCIGIAASMKYYPALPLVALLSIRAYKPLLVGTATALVTTALCLLYIDPTIVAYLNNIKQAATFMGDLYAAKMQFPEFDHSIFMLYKILYSIFKHSSDPTYVANFKSGPYLAAMAVFGLSLYFLRLNVMPILNQLIGLVVCAVAMPPVSYDYALIILLMPAVLLCLFAAQAWRDGRRVRGLYPAFAFLSLIFTWGTFLTIHQVRFSGQVRAAALLGLLAVVLVYPFRQPPKEVVPYNPDEIAMSGAI